MCPIDNQLIMQLISRSIKKSINQIIKQLDSYSIFSVVNEEAIDESID